MDLRETCATQHRQCGFSKDQGQKSETDWAQVPASVTPYHHQFLRKLFNLALFLAHGG